MISIQNELSIQTRQREFVDITDIIFKQVEASNISTGICHLFIHHTSASLIICENADKDVKRDLETFMQRIAPDSDSLYKHIAEGPDDMPAHIRSILTQSDLSVPISHGQLGLGRWQGIYLWEHRLQGASRKITLTLFGT
jgi:secondary thiamine-phosphate synthase enzyme